VEALLAYLRKAVAMLRSDSLTAAQPPTVPSLKLKPTYFELLTGRDFGILDSSSTFVTRNLHKTDLFSK